jgi:hypothetical protein
MMSIVIGIICLAVGVFTGYRIGGEPGTSFMEKAKAYFTLRQ